jgi:hypothetical protein
VLQTTIEHRLCMLMLTLLNIVIGHFSTAPLYEHLIGEDPLSGPALTRQTEFFAQVFAALTEGPPRPSDASVVSPKSG